MPLMHTSTDKGVPQGSVLGPPLGPPLLLYLVSQRNHELEESQVHVFIDDVK